MAAKKKGIDHHKIVLVTGGSRGLGHALASRLAADGFTVIAGSRSAQALSPKTPLPSPEIITPIQLDVTDEKSVKRVFQWLQKKVGRLDVLINNAGVGVFKKVTEISSEEWTSVIATNLTGAFFCCREAFRLMKKQNHGRIVNIGSVADKIPLPENAAYGASKWGLRGLSYILNEEGKSHGIRVSHLGLGAISTDIWKGRRGFSPKDMLHPSDVADVVADIISKPDHVRIDELRLLPPKGIL